MQRTKLILDCDPGHDDAFAILLALASDEIDLLGITTVAGNAQLADATRNALVCRAMANRKDIGVYQGADAPLHYPLVTAPHIHGKSGLDTASGQTPALDLGAIESQSAVDFIVETCRQEPAGSVTLAPVGPMTNIALALQQAPEIAERIHQIVFMGGVALDVGNTTPAAEFNIYVDPHAADIVFKSSIPLVMHGLDITHQMLVTDERVSDFANLPEPLGPWLADLLAFFNRFDRKRYQSLGAPLHDPCTIAYLLAPEIFSGKDCNLRVETESELTRGQTVVDWWEATDLPKNAKVMTKGDDQKFFELITTRLAKLALENSNSSL